MATPEATLDHVLSELREVRSELETMTTFVNNLQAVLSEMSTNPMLKAFGIGGLDGLTVSPPDMAMLPGMPPR